MAQSQRVILLATPPHTVVRLTWMPEPVNAENDTAVGPACLCVHSVAVPRDYRKSSPEPLQRRVPASALTGASMHHAAMLHVDLALEETSLACSPGLVRYHLDREGAPRDAARAGCVSPDVCVVGGVDQVVLGCCWVGGREEERCLLAVASDQDDPSGVSVDVFAVCMPTDDVDDLAKGGKSANSTSVTLVGRYTVAPVGSRFAVACVTGYGAIVAAFNFVIAFILCTTHSGNHDHA